MIDQFSDQSLLLNGFRTNQNQSLAGERRHLFNWFIQSQFGFVEIEVFPNIVIFFVLFPLKNQIFVNKENT